MQTEPTRHPPRYRLVFEGEYLTSHNPQAVRTTMLKTLLLDDGNAARLFFGKRVEIWQVLAAASARCHIKRFARMGAVLRAEPAKPRQSLRPRSVQSVATLPSAATSTVAKLPLGMNAQALVEHQQQHLSAKTFKANALSNDGAFAGHAGAATEHEARDMALNRCMAAMSPGDHGCRVVNSGGRWEE